MNTSDRDDFLTRGIAQKLKLEFVQLNRLTGFLVRHYKDSRVKDLKWGAANRTLDPELPETEVEAWVKENQCYLSMERRIEFLWLLTKPLDGYDLQYFGCKLPESERKDFRARFDAHRQAIGSVIEHFYVEKGWTVDTRSCDYIAFTKGSVRVGVVFTLEVDGDLIVSVKPPRIIS